MTAFLTDVGVEIALKSFLEKCPKNPNGCLNQFKATAVLTRDIKKTTAAYECRDGILYLPRYGTFKLMKQGYINKVKNLISEPVSVPSLKYVGKLKPNQKTVLKHIVKNHLNSENAKIGNSTVSVIMKAGRGKSFLAMGAIHVLKTKTAIVVPTDKVMFGWKKILTTFFPNNSVGLFYGKKKQPEADIVVMMINTVVSQRVDQNILNQFGFTIFDEIHRYCSPEFSKVFQRMTTKYVLGLTATPDRPQKEDIVFRSQIGPVVHAENIPGYIVDDVKFEGKIRVMKYTGPGKYTKQLRNPTTKTNSTPALISQICQDPYRNQMIVEEILKIYNDKHDVFVFSDRLEHLDIIQRMLEGNGVKKSAVLTGGAAEDYTRRVFDEAIIILTTYQASDTGVSIDRMTGVVFVTPRRNLMEQKLGRILRIGGDLTIVRQVVDIVDVKLSIKTQYPARKKVYMSEGFGIEEVDVDWESYQNLNIQESDSEKSEESGEHETNEMKLQKTFGPVRMREDYSDDTAQTSS
jgi:superfamily II DNA or RNA helicase